MTGNESPSGPTGDARDTGSDAANAPRSITPARRQDALRELNRGRSGLDFLIEWGKILLVSVVLFGLIRTFLV
ncbi:MAG: hypothetical protein ACREPM_21220, partial [Gemmatimonadaceae bacterium]